MQTNANNTQLSAGAVGGGPGALTVQNNASTKVSDFSAASSQSGLSVALAPTAVTGAASPQTGITTAASGKSSATGVTVSNDLSHTAVVGVSVAGGSQAPVNVSSNSTVAVQDQGASAAVSGQAWAVAAGAAGSPSGVTAPVVTGAAGATSPDVSVTGLQAKNDLSKSTENVVTSAGAASITAPILITPSEVASVTARGVVDAASSAACSGNACQPGTPAAAAVQAATGVADARGLTANNVVNTRAAVSVHVAGRNFSPIQIIVDSITRVFNLGIGSAQSGDATVWGGPSAALTAGQTATTGNVQAIGAQVQNTVDLRSAATVVVNGDNHSPIDIVLTLAASLFNRGIAMATSGDAQSSAAGGPGSASTGGAAATGLQALNIVNMFALASVDIEGDNYAPIVVEVHFKTSIANVGIGVATTGNAAAGQSGPQTASSSTAASRTGASSTSATVGGSLPGSSKGGDATAIANSVDAAFGSTQISNANGGQSVSVATIQQMLQNLPPRGLDPFALQNLPQTTSAVVQPGMNSSSGDTRSDGLHAAVTENSSQLAACADAGVSCVARNNATLSAEMSDSANNPAERNPQSGGGGGGGGGGTTASSGDSLLNATPTPIPSPKKGASGSRNSTTGSDGSGGGSSRRPSSRHVTFNSQVLATGFVPNGQNVVVDFWDNWPARRLPPMPSVQAHAPATTTVGVSLNSWPAADELPLPGSGSDAAEQHAAQSPRPSVGPPHAGASLDQPAESDEDRLPNVLSVFNTDPFGWPATAALPLPPQIVTAGAVAQMADEESTSDSATVPDGGIPTETLIAAVLAASVAAGVGGTRRGRSALMSMHRRLRDFLSSCTMQLHRVNSLVRSVIPW